MRIAKFVLLAVLVAGLAVAIAATVGRRSSHPLAGEFPGEWYAPVLSINEVKAQKQLLGKPMPILDLSDWRNGEVTGDVLKGKVVVVDFWATWCGPCIAAIPDNNKLYAAYKPKGMEFIGVCTDIGQENLDKVLARHKPQYPIARDAMMKTGTAWGVMSYPTYAVIDRKGIVRAIGLRHDYVEQVVQKLLEE